MKSFLSLIGSLIIIIMLITKRHIAHSSIQILVIWLSIIFWGFILLISLPRKIIQSSPLLNSFNDFLEDNDVLSYYLMIIFNALLIELLLFSYTPEEAILNILRICFIIFLLLGLSLIVINMIRTRPWNNKEKSE